MRRLLVHVLESNDQDMFEEVALRSFWSLPKPLAPASINLHRESERIEANTPPGARVINLAQWAWQRGRDTRT